MIHGVELVHSVRVGVWVVVGLCGLVGSLLVQRTPLVHTFSVMLQELFWPCAPYGFLCCIPTAREFAPESPNFRFVPRRGVR